LQTGGEEGEFWEGVEWEKLREERAKTAEYLESIKNNSERWEIFDGFGVGRGEYFPLGWREKLVGWAEEMSGLRGDEGKPKVRRGFGFTSGCNEGRVGRWFAVSKALG